MSNIVLAKSTGRLPAPTKLDKCVAWLSDWLHDAGEPLSPQDIVAEAKSVGFSRATVFRAREVLATRIKNTVGRRNTNNLWAWQDDDENVTA